MESTCRRRVPRWRRLGWLPVADRPLVSQAGMDRLPGCCPGPGLHGGRHGRLPLGVPPPDRPPRRAVTPPFTALDGAVTVRRYSAR